MHQPSALTGDRLLTVREISQRTGLGKSTVYDLIASGQLRSRRIGRAIRVPQADYEGWLDSLPSAARDRLPAASHSRPPPPGYGSGPGRRDLSGQTARGVRTEEVARFSGAARLLLREWLLTQLRQEPCPPVEALLEAGAALVAENPQLARAVAQEVLPGLIRQELSRLVRRGWAEVRQARRQVQEHR